NGGRRRVVLVGAGRRGTEAAGGRLHRGGHFLLRLALLVRAVGGETEQQAHQDPEGDEHAEDDEDDDKRFRAPLGSGPILGLLHWKILAGKWMRGAGKSVHRL